MIRDLTKNEEYYLKYIKTEEKRISDFESILNSLGEEKIEGKRRCLTTIFRMRFNLMIAKYSSGDSIENMTQEYRKVIDLAMKVGSLSYFDILTLSSIDILINESKNIPKLKEISNQLELTDNFLNYFFNDSEVIDDDKIFKPYKYLTNVINQSNKREEYLKEYLENKWYTGNEDMYWYGSDKNGSDTFFGYWSFEAAAIAKKLNINIQNLKGTKYFPFELI